MKRPRCVQGVAGAAFPLMPFALLHAFGENVLRGISVAAPTAMASFDQKNSSEHLPLESLVNEAEARLREGLNQLSDWSEQARRVLEERPSAALAGIGTAGFVAGMILRGSPTRSRFASEPLLAFLAAGLVGYFAGPKVLELGDSHALKGAPTRVTSLDRH